MQSICDQFAKCASEDLVVGHESRHRARDVDCPFDAGSFTSELDSASENLAHFVRSDADMRIVGEHVQARDQFTQLMRGVNDDEVADFADFARHFAVDMRLIEFMPLDSSRNWSREQVVSADEMLERIGVRHELVPLYRDDPASTSLNFAFADGVPGRLGIIAPVTRPFCGACSRLRVTADGKVRPCLFSHEEWDLKPLLRAGAPDDTIMRFLVDAMWTKQAGHGIGSVSIVQPSRTMSAIGG